jgi:hypothetical protein
MELQEIAAVEDSQEKAREAEYFCGSPNDAGTAEKKGNRSVAAREGQRI